MNMAITSLAFSSITVKTHDESKPESPEKYPTVSKDRSLLVKYLLEKCVLCVNTHV